MQDWQILKDIIMPGESSYAEVYDEISGMTDEEVQQDYDLPKATVLSELSVLKNIVPITSIVIGEGFTKIEYDDYGNNHVERFFNIKHSDLTSVTFPSTIPKGDYSYYPDLSKDKYGKDTNLTILPSGY